MSFVIDEIKFDIRLMSKMFGTHVMAEGIDWNEFLANCKLASLSSAMLTESLSGAKVDS